MLLKLVTNRSIKALGPYLMIKLLNTMKSATKAASLIVLMFVSSSSVYSAVLKQGDSGFLQGNNLAQMEGHGNVKAAGGSKLGAVLQGLGADACFGDL